MAVELADTLRDVVTDIGKNLDGIDGVTDRLSGRKAVAVAAAAALTPLAAKGVGKLAESASTDGIAETIKAPKKAVQDATSSVGEKISGGVSDKIEEKVTQAGGPAGMLKGALKNALPFGGGDEEEDDDSGVRGIGKGRRMPV